VQAAGLQEEVGLYALPSCLVLPLEQNFTWNCRADFPEADFLL